MMKAPRTTSPFQHVNSNPSLHQRRFERLESELEEAEALLGNREGHLARDRQQAQRIAGAAQRGGRAIEWMPNLLGELAVYRFHRS